MKFEWLKFIWEVVREINATTNAYEKVGMAAMWVSTFILNMVGENPNLQLITSIVTLFVSIFTGFYIAGKSIGVMLDNYEKYNNIKNKGKGEDK